MLFYLSKIDEIDNKVQKADGIIISLIQTHTNLNIAISYMPEYFFTSFSEKISGIFYKNS